MTTTAQNAATAASANGSSGGAGGPPPPVYRSPRPLNAAADAGKCLAPMKDFRFAIGANAVPLGAGEFHLAMRHYPIVFAGDAQRTVLAVLGLRNENFFIGEDGQWLPDHYIPSYIRRYPFISMEQPDSDQLILCIDEASPLLGNSGEPLFTAGQPSKFVKDVLESCRELHAHHKMSHAFGAALAQHNLLIRNEARFVTQSGVQQTLTGFDVIDEAKFTALPDETFLEFRRQGWLPLVYSQLLSMANWSTLARLSEARLAKGS